MKHPALSHAIVLSKEASKLFERPAGFERPIKAKDFQVLFSHARSLESFLGEYSDKDIDNQTYAYATKIAGCVFDRAYEMLDTYDVVETAFTAKVTVLHNVIHNPYQHGAEAFARKVVVQTYFDKAESRTSTKASVVYCFHHRDEIERRYTLCTDTQQELLGTTTSAGVPLEAYHKASMSAALREQLHAWQTELSRKQTDPLQRHLLTIGVPNHAVTLPRKCKYEKHPLMQA